MSSVTAELLILYVYNYVPSMYSFIHSFDSLHSFRSFMQHLFKVYTRCTPVCAGRCMNMCAVGNFYNYSVPLNNLQQKPNVPCSTLKCIPPVQISKHLFALSKLMTSQGKLRLVNMEMSHLVNMEMSHLNFSQSSTCLNLSKGLNFCVTKKQECPDRSTLVWTCFFTGSKSLC